MSIEWRALDAIVEHEQIIKREKDEKKVLRRVREVAHYCVDRTLYVSCTEMNE